MEIELEKLKVYDKEKNDFISNISHELRTPFKYILLNSSITRYNK